MTIKILFPVILFISSVIFLPASVQAHRILVFAYGDGPAITGETTFSSGRKAKNVEITVMDEESKKVLATTKTNEKGEFRFNIPEEAVQKRLNLLIVANVGDGHRGEWHMAAEDYLEDTATDSEGLSSPATTEKPAMSQPAQAAPPSAAAAASGVETRHEGQCLTSAQIEQIVEHVMDKKLAPVKHMLVQACEPGPSITDILGGIGYIIGLGGVAAYMKSKKREA